LIAALATRFVRTLSANGLPTAFSVGFADSPDIEKALSVAKHLCVPHVVHVVTPEQCVAVIPGKVRKNARNLFKYPKNILYLKK
jgi:asparagine synthetase B (glutamine-hydrolysing)